MSSLFSQFAALLPDQSVRIVTVISVSAAAGTSVVQSLQGAQYVVRGTSVAPGSMAQVRQQAIIGPASNLPTVSVSV